MERVRTQAKAAAQLPLTKTVQAPLALMYNRGDLSGQAEGADAP